MSSAACRQTDSNQGRDRSESDSLKEWQADTDLGSKSCRLNDRGDTTGEEVRVNQVNSGCRIESQSGGNNQRNDNRPGVKRQDMLKAKDCELGERRDRIDRVDVDGGHFWLAICHGGAPARHSKMDLFIFTHFDQQMKVPSICVAISLVDEAAPPSVISRGNSAVSVSRKPPDVIDDAFMSLLVKTPCA